MAIELQWLLGILSSVVSGGLLFWAKTTHDTLREINGHVRNLAEFRGRVEQHIIETDRRINALENRLERAI